MPWYTRLLYLGIGHLAAAAETDCASIIHGMVQGGAGIHQAIRQRHGDAHGVAGCQALDRAAGWRAVEVGAVGLGGVELVWDSARPCWRAGSLPARAAHARAVCRAPGCAGFRGPPRTRGVLEVSSAEAGVHLVGWLPKDAADREVSRRAGAAGVSAPAVSSYVLGSDARPGLLLGYAAVNGRRIRDGTGRLAHTMLDLRL